jgi:hypothetical protein
MLLLPVIGIGILLILVGAGWRWRTQGRARINEGWFTSLVFTSFGIGTAVGTLLVPSAWLVISYAMRGGTVEHNLPPGSDVNGILAALVLGVLVTLVYAVKGYVDCLRRR